MTPDAADVAARLGVADVVFVPVVAGAANLAYEVHDAADPDGPPVAFLRVQGPGALHGSDYDLRREAAIVRAAGALGFPVAAIIATYDEPVSVLMGVVPGTSLPDPDDLDAVAAEYMGLIARLHDTDPSSFPVTAQATLGAAVRADIDWWQELAVRDGVDRIPILALAHRVLVETAPDGDGPPSLVHGDVGAGNFMIHDGRVSAMLDWEISHLGDPHEDLAWMWMRGAHTSFGDPLDRIAEYAEAAGTRIDRSRLRWHLASVMWKSCVSMEAGLRRYEPEHGTIVRLVVLLTYEALLGAQLVRVLGGEVDLCGQRPDVEPTPTSRAAELLVATPGLPREPELIAQYLRDAAAQAEWEQRELHRELREIAGTEAGPLAELVGDVEADRLVGLATVVARAADRAAMAMPKAIRRIERAKGIGLGTATERWRSDLT